MTIENQDKLEGAIERLAELASEVDSDMAKQDIVRLAIGAGFKESDLMDQYPSLYASTEVEEDEDEEKDEEEESDILEDLNES